MTIRPIRYLGDPVLRLPARRVRTVDDSVRRLIDDMIESMEAAQGVGLAAPQIGVGLRVVVLGLPGEEPFALVNPEVVERIGARRAEGEGCLSVPGYRGAPTRSERVVVEALDARGEPIRLEEEGNLLAQALEHEVDHVNGLLYVDRLGADERLTKLDGQDWAEAGAADREREVGSAEADDGAGDSASDGDGGSGGGG
ncbi:MAG: peptide deformylase [Chloroflexi bacterium]|nr:peptide deformylase [Chloroflexota bacterium]